MLKFKSIFNYLKQTEYFILCPILQTDLIELNMEEEKYSLTWNAYTDHLREMLHDMRVSNNFTDVILVCEDKKHIKAHRNILSASSPVFLNIFLMEGHKNHNPVVYLRGIQHQELEAIMQFIYLGQATFSSERMEEFLQVAKSLEVKELCESVESFQQTTLSQPVQVPVHVKEEHLQLFDDDYDDIEFMHTGEFTNDKDYSPSPPYAFPDKNVDANGKRKLFQCKECDRVFSSHQGLWGHKKAVHDGVTYACDQCDYKAAKKSNLTQHIQVKHENTRYPCSMCDYQATHQTILRRHMKLKHT